MPRPTRFLSLASELEKRIADDGTFELSSIRESALKMRVSYTTMWKAAQVLIDKGLVASRSGKKLCVVREKSAPGLKSSVDRVTDTIRRQIVQGHHQAGRQFPKLSYYADSHGVSPATVSASLLRLSGENLVHRWNRRWIVGPRPTRASSRTTSAGSVVFITAVQGNLTKLFEVGFTSAFYQALRDQLMSRNIGFIPTAKYRQKGEQVLVVPTGLEQIREAIRSLGDEYRGALVSLVHPREENAEELFVELARLGKPVVYLDSAGQGAFLTRKTLGVKKEYYRLHIDETRAVRLALEALADHGHQTIGTHSLEFDWARRRTELFEQEARTRRPPLKFVSSAAPKEGYWGFQQWNRGLEQLVKNTRQLLGEKRSVDKDGIHKSAFRDQLSEQTPELCSLLIDHGPTALVCMNDEVARQHFLWTRLMGIRVPRDLSLISFDNSPESLLFPISTIDFGLARLGYLAAHIFIGDIPAQTDHTGSIAGQCTVVEHGSLGPPAQAGRLRRILAG